MNYQHQEKHAIIQSMFNIEQAIESAYKHGKSTNKSVTAMIKKITTRRNVIYSDAPKKKIKGVFDVKTIETVISDNRISFLYNQVKISNKKANTITSEFPFIISNHAIDRFFERSSETDYMADYHSTITFLSLFSLMHVYGKESIVNIIIPCESGLLFGKIVGQEEIKHSAYSTISKTHFTNFTHPAIKKPMAAKIILTTFVSHKEMFQDQKILWEKMMTFYDENTAMLNDTLWMSASMMNPDNDSPAKFFETLIQDFTNDIATEYNNVQLK